MARAAVIAVFFASRVAGADPTEVAAAEPPGATAPADEPPQRDVVAAPIAPPTAPAMPIDQPRSYDAAYDRAFAYGTALALEPGDFDVSLRSMLRHGAIASVAAGIGHNVELSVQGIKSSYLGEGVGAGVKLTTVRERRIAVAFDANIFAFVAGLSSSDERLYSASVILTTCVTAECSVLFDAGAGVAVGTRNFSDPEILPTLHTSMLFGTSWARPIVELAWMSDWMGFAGLRFGGRHVGVDAGLGMVSDTGPGGSATTAVIGLNVRP